MENKPDYALAHNAVHGVSTIYPTVNASQHSQEVYHQSFMAKMDALLDLTSRPDARPFYQIALDDRRHASDLNEAATAKTATSLSPTATAENIVAIRPKVKTPVVQPPTCAS